MELLVALRDAEVTEMADMMRNRRVGAFLPSYAVPTSEVKPQQPISCQRLRKKLQVLDFAIIETALYLDAYPNCRHALDHYHKLVAERDALAATINEKCGPICQRENKSRTDWTWVRGPWPWEIDANC